MTSSERLFSYYDRELTFIRQLALDFKARYPRVADRLALDAAAQSTDPHVERMIEAFALLTANVQVKLDDEFPELTDALLNVLYPHYLAPLPSMAIVQFSLLPGSMDAPQGLVLPRHSYLVADPVEGVPCRFRTANATTLWPIEVAEAKFRDPPYPPGLEPPSELRHEIRSYLSLRLRVMGNAPLEQLQIDKLRLFLLGEAQQTVGLYEALFTELRHVVIVPENRRLPPTRLTPAEAVFPVGFKPDEGVLPYPKQAFIGYRLLSEFFAYPGRFNFFDLGGWAQARGNGLVGKQVEVVFYFSRPPRDGMTQGVQRGTFVPGCVPVINLFEKTVEGFKLTHRKTEYQIEPDIHAPHGYEVYSVDEVDQIDPQTGEVVQYRPFYSFHHGTRDSGPPFYYLNRRSRIRQKIDGRHDPENSVGTDVDLRLVNMDMDPLKPADATVTVRTTCLNRDLPRRLREAGEGLNFHLVTAAPVKVRTIRPPSPTLRPSVRRRAFWRLMSHLNLNHLSITDSEQGKLALQEYLRLYDFADAKSDPQLAAIANQVIEGLLSVQCAPTVQFTGSQTAGGYARGVAVDIEINDENYAGVGGYLFACIIDRFLSLYVSINSFTQLTVRTNRKDAEPWRFPPRGGDMPLL
jgi:type VI secretion system protein ImpG